MRVLLIPIVISPIFFVACDEKPKNPIAVQGDRMLDAYHRAQDLRDEANLDEIKKAIQTHRAVNDKFPQDLKEIKPLLAAPDLNLSKYTYNSSLS